MHSENETNATQPSANIYLIVMFASVTSTIAMSAIFLFVVSLEPWLTYLVLGVVWMGEFITLAVFHSFYKKATHPRSTYPRSDGLVWSGFGEQRPNIGSRSPSQRR